MIVFCTVSPPDGILSSSLRCTLSSSKKAGELARSVVEMAQTIPGFAAATTGNVTAEIHDGEAVSISMRLKNLNYDVLKSVPTLGKSFQKKVINALARQIGVTPDDVQDVIYPVLGVRMGLDSEASDRVVSEVLEAVPLPEYKVG